MTKMARFFWIMNFKMRLVSLILILSKEFTIGHHLWKWSIPYLWPKWLKTPALWGCKYLYSPSMGVPTPTMVSSNVRFCNLSCSETRMPFYITWPSCGQNLCFPFLKYVWSATVTVSSMNLRWGISTLSFAQGLTKGASFRVIWMRINWWLHSGHGFIGAFNEP